MQTQPMKLNVVAYIKRGEGGSVTTGHFPAQEILSLASQGWTIRPYDIFDFKTRTELQKILNA